MNFFEKITGSDMKKEMKGLEARAKVLPVEYQTAWKEMKNNLWIQGDFTGRNRMPMMNRALELLEVALADGQSVEVLEKDTKGFYAASVGDKGAKTYQDKWRDQLNKSVAKKLGGLK